MRYLLLLLFLTNYPQLVCGDIYRFEAEDFPEKGKWETSFSKDASEGKLLFAGAAEDNSIEASFKIPEDGDYILWARSFGYGQNYRKYEVELNGRKNSILFGDEPGTDTRPSFTFTKGDTFQLKKDIIKIKLIPHSQYARCDMVLLTTDETFVPSSDIKEIKRIPKLTPTNTAPFSADTKDGVSVLLFHGGRPWTGKGTATILKDSGAIVKLVDSTRLAGLGGASIKKFLTDLVEPEPEDGITPAFEVLGSYSVVIVSAMSPEDQIKFFTPERIEKLKRYIEHGGALIVAENVPSVLADLLPVKFSGYLGFSQDEVYCKSRHDMFSGIPKKWPYLGRNRQVTAKEGSEILAVQIHKSGKNIGPYISCMDIGKGKVLYWNSEWRRKNHFRQLRDWAYFGTIFVRLVEHVSGSKLDRQKVIYKRLKIPEIKKIGEAYVKVAAPVYRETGNRFKRAKVKEDEKTLSVRFSNGVALKINKEQATLSVYYPGLEQPVIADMAPPVFMTSGTSEHEQWDESSSEAVPTGGSGKSEGGALRAKYDFVNWASIKQGGVRVKLRGATADKTRFAVSWIFRPKNVTVYERTYVGFGDSIEVSGLDERVEKVCFSTPVCLGESVDQHSAWLMACYGNPRGFAEVPFTATTASTSHKWQHFGSGQPFNWINSPAGVLCEFLDVPAVNTSEISHDKGDDCVRIENNILLGRLRPPLKTPFVWHLYSAGKATDANPWMAMYQYLRIRYCEKTGIKTAQPLPTSLHVNTCTEEQVGQTIEAAKRLGFSRHMLPLCPSSLETLADPGVAAIYQEIIDAGMNPKPWSPGTYTQGMDNKTARDHPEWLVYDRDGKVLQYFESHPVFDLNNESYFKYYFGVIDKAISLGMKDIYLDMGGAQAAVVNYKSADPVPGLTGAIKAYRALRNRGISVGIEGQNPLVLDNFWYRKGRYVDHSGKEFAFIGMSVYTNTPDHLAMDYFRLGMYNAFFTSTISGYACGMETVPDENMLTEEIGKLNPMFNEAIATVGRPFVCQTSFGTMWTSEKGAALFIWHPVTKLRVKLPRGWAIDKVMTLKGMGKKSRGTVVRDIGNKSIVLIKKR